MDREARRRLRAAAYGGNAGEIMAVLKSDVVRELPQICGEALLVALAGDAAGAQSLAGECIAALSARDWAGDAELAADLQYTLGRSATPELTPVPIEIEQLADLLRGGEHHAGGESTSVPVRPGRS